MAGPALAFPSAVRCWLAAGCLALLAGCATPPEPPVSAAPAALAVSAALAAPAGPVDPALVVAAPATPQSTPSTAPVTENPPRPSRLADFIARRLRKQIETPAPVAEAETPAPVAEAEAPVATDIPVDGKYQFTGEDARELERGNASWYGAQFHGRPTASGESYDKYALTAAHRTLPFGTIVRVRSLALGREVDVRINDRGPFSSDRVIDVSRAAAEALGLIGAGVIEVSLNVENTSKVVMPRAKPNRKIRKSSRRPVPKKPAIKRR